MRKLPLSFNFSIELRKVDENNIRAPKNVK